MMSNPSTSSSLVVESAVCVVGVCLFVCLFTLQGHKLNGVKYRLSSYLLWRIF